MSPRAPTGAEGFSTMESASLLNPRTEHELQQSFGQSVASVKDSGSPGARQQIAADVHALSSLIQKGVQHKKSSIPTTWSEVYNVAEGYVPLMKTIRTYKKEYYYLDFVAGLVGECSGNSHASILSSYSSSCFTTNDPSSIACALHCRGCDEGPPGHGM